MGNFSFKWDRPYCSPTHPLDLSPYCIPGGVLPVLAVQAILSCCFASQLCSVTPCVVLVSCCLQSVTEERAESLWKERGLGPVALGKHHWRKVSSVGAKENRTEEWGRGVEREKEKGSTRGTSDIFCKIQNQDTEERKLMDLKEHK